MAKALMRKDLTGLRFGKLVARQVDEAKTTNGKVYWLCDCDCGNTTSVQSISLTRKRGNVKSCGCLKHIAPCNSSKKIDMIGKRFGRLLVTEDAGHRQVGSRMKLQYKCICDCGSECCVVGESLRSGITRSCGCLYKETRYEIAKVTNEYDVTSYEYGVGYCQNGAEFYFDKEDLLKIKRYCWNYDGRYVQAHTLANDEYSTKIIRLHRLVMDINDREDINIDHINGITNDCRKTNLRKATDYQNNVNQQRAFATIDNPVGITKTGDYYTVNIAGHSPIKCSSFGEAFKIRKHKEEEIFGEFQWNPDADKICKEDTSGACHKRTA